MSTNPRVPRPAATDFEEFERSSTKRRRLLRQEQLILDVSEALVGLLESEEVTRAEVARRLGKTKGFITQILGGDKNLTLRTIADFCDAVGFRATIDVTRDFVAQSCLVEYQVLSLARRNQLNIRYQSALPGTEVCPEQETRVA